MSRSLAPRIGVLLPTREAVLIGAPDAAPLVEAAVQAEKLGYDSVWAGESPLARARVDPLAILSAAAAVTEAVELGTAVLLPVLRHPVMLAQTVASVDQIAEGRLLLGVGAGFPLPATQAQFEAVGAAYDQRVGRLVESARICRLLWSSDEPVDFDGKYWNISEVELKPKPVRPGGPPLWLGAGGERGLRRTGRHFDGWLPYPPSPHQYEDEWGQVREAASEGGRDADSLAACFYATFALDDDEERAQRTLEDYVERYYGFPFDAVSQVQAFFAGGPEACVQWLADYVRAGARHIILRFATLDGHPEMMEAVAEGVVVPLRGVFEQVEVTPEGKS